MSLLITCFYLFNNMTYIYQYVKALTNALLGLVFFSLAVSSIYNLNDILDIKDDQADPVKTSPIAGAALSVSSAIKVMVVFIAAVNGLCFLFPRMHVWFVCAPVLFTKHSVCAAVFLYFCEFVILGNSSKV